MKDKKDKPERPLTQLEKLIKELKKEGFKPLEPRVWRRVKNHVVQDAVITHRGGKFTYNIVRTNQ